MNVGSWLGLAALVVAIIAIPAAVLATRHWGNRRARLEVEIHTIPLLPEHARRGLLEVTYKDVPVKEPHLVSVTLRNSGPRDVASGIFDGQRSITVKFDQIFYGLTAAYGGVEIRSPAIGASAVDAAVSIQPALLKRGESWSFSAVTTGPVGVAIDAPLIDTEVQVIVPPEEGRVPLTLQVSVLGLTAEVPLRWKS